MKIAVVGNDSNISQSVQSKLKNKIKPIHNLKLDNKYPDVVISVGGDGTFLSAFHKYQKNIDNIRFIGINAGHLGFYSDWLANQTDSLINALQNDDGKDVSYALLSVAIHFDNGKTKKFLALNESTIKRVNTTMKCNVYVNKEFIGKFRGDGLCVASPTGSTAYNKSLSGAVMCPTINAIQLTTMAPLINKVYKGPNFPLIVPKGDSINLYPEDDLKNIITCDNDLIEGKAIKQINYKVSSHRIHFKKFNHISFWSRVNKSFIG